MLFKRGGIQTWLRQISEIARNPTQQCSIAAERTSVSESNQNMQPTWLTLLHRTGLDYRRANRPFQQMIWFSVTYRCGGLVLIPSRTNSQSLLLHVHVIEYWNGICGRFFFISSLNKSYSCWLFLVHPKNRILYSLLVSPSLCLLA